MLTKIFSPFLFVSLIIFLFISNTQAVNTITSDNPNFQYTGRIDFTDPLQPVIYWSGTYVNAKFEGRLLLVTLDDETGNSYYDVYIDEDFENPHLINCSAGTQSYLVSAQLSDSVHTMLLFRRTEASTGSTKFLGIQLEDGKNILPPPAKPLRKILFYGNSITCGMGNEAPDNFGDDNLAYENNFLAYGAVTSRMLNAQYMCVAKSGIGIMISWFDMVMSEYYYRLDPDDSSSHWNFDEFIPDVVGINLMQNDSWLINDIVPVPDSAERVAAYVKFVREIRQKHPDAFIVCSLGSMDATQEGSPWPGYIEAAVDNMRTQFNDTKLGTLFFQFDPAWTKHPRVRHHQAMAQLLSDYISEQVGWVTDVQNNPASQSPKEFYLSQNYPNPFNPSTIINYQIPNSGNVSLKIYDILGKEVATLVDGFKDEGNYEVNFEASNLASGVYFYTLRTGSFVQSKKMIFLR